MRRRRPAPRLTVTAEPLLRAGTTTTIAVDADEGTVRVWLRLLGWDMRVSRRWLLAESEGVGSRQLTATLPEDLPPGCARMTEYAIFAELLGQRAAAAAPVRLIGDAVWWPEGPRGDGIELDDEVVAIGGELRGRVTGTGEVGAELHTAAAAPRFLPIASVEGNFAVTIPRDVPPTLHDGEDLGITWTVRAGDAWRRFAVVDPDGEAGERRPPLLSFLARLSRDPFLGG